MQTPTVETITLTDPASPQRGEYVAYLATNKFGKQRAFATEATATQWANKTYAPRYSTSPLNPANR